MGLDHGDSRPSSDLEAIEFLVARVPVLAPTIAEHVADNDEVLPYLAFADFNRWFCAGVRAGHSEAELRAYVDAVEVLLTTDVDPPAYDSVWNLAAVSTEDSDWIGADVLARIEGWLGPATRASLGSHLLDAQLMRAWNLGMDSDGWTEAAMSEAEELVPPLVAAGYMAVDDVTDSWRFTEPGMKRIQRIEALRPPE